MKTAGKNIDINLQAMGKMSEICDVLERSGYQGRDLETYGSPAVLLFRR